MKLSVIITVYNGEKYLRRCLDSAISQKLEEYEIVVVNDGSTDASESIIEEYYHQYPHLIHYIKQKNRGVSSARNTGIKESKGEYVTYIDCDDYIQEDIYGSLLKIAKQGNYDIVVFDLLIEEGQKKKYCQASQKKESGEMTRQEYVLSVPSPCNKLMKRKLFTNSQITFPEGMLYEDFATIPTLANEAQRIYYEKKPYYYYFQSEGSIMRNGTYKESYVDIFKAVTILHNNLKKQDFQKEIEFLYYLYILVEASLYFYQFGKEEYLVLTANKIKQEFPNWRKNPYVKKDSFKRKLYANLFYYKQYKLLKLAQAIKNKIRRKANDK